MKFAPAEGRAHDLLSDVGTILPLSVVVTAFTSCVIWIATGLAIVQSTAEQLSIAVTIMKWLGIVLIVMVVTRRPEVIAVRARDWFGRVGDIAGFWSPDTQPLAGTSYRRAVLRAISNTVRYEHRPRVPLALVGHSQGSVVAAWWMAVLGQCGREVAGIVPTSCSDDEAEVISTGREGVEIPTDRELASEWSRDPSTRSVTSPPSGPDSREAEPILLVTCGCPLTTLYETFFPFFFNEGFFRAANTATEGAGWRNYWRQTDPIASPLMHPNIDNINVTETAGTTIYGHSRYFADPRLAGDVDGHLPSLEPAKSSPPSIEPEDAPGSND